MLETKRMRAQRQALTRAVEREHVHAEAFGRRRPRPKRPARDGEVRVSRGALTMTFEAFRAADFGKLCAFLGLSPSRPTEPAAPSA